MRWQTMSPETQTRTFDENYPVLIHVCKDRTLSFRTRDEKIFNGVALAVFSVRTKDEAEALIRTVGSLQYEEHPQMPGRPWRKISLDSKPFEPYLELEDLDEVHGKLKRVYDRIYPTWSAEDQALANKQGWGLYPAADPAALLEVQAVDDWEAAGLPAPRFASDLTARFHVHNMSLVGNALAEHAVRVMVAEAERERKARAA